MFKVPEDGIVLLDVERDVFACLARVAEVSGEEDPDFTGIDLRCGLFVVET